MPEYDIALELARLHILTGADFVRQLKMLASLSIFKPVENEKDIFAANQAYSRESALPDTIPAKVCEIKKPPQKVAFKMGQGRYGLTPTRKIPD